MTNKEAANLVLELKRCIDDNMIHVPLPGEKSKKTVQTVYHSDIFTIYLRRGTVKESQLTFHVRHNLLSINFMRIDVDGPPHTNPDNAVVYCPHIHVYDDKYDLDIAYPFDIISGDVNELSKQFLITLMSLNTT